MAPVIGCDDLLCEAIKTSPNAWRKEHIEILPKYYLLDSVSSYTLHKIWDQLPDHLKNDTELQSHLPCLEHYNRPEDHTHIDGPPPPKYRCRGCKRAQKQHHIDS